MINRVCTFTEIEYGDPVYTQTGVDPEGFPVYTQTGFTNSYFMPVVSGLDNKIGYVSRQGDSGFYIVYGKFRNGRAVYRYIMYRHSAGAYLVWCRKGLLEKIEAAPYNGMRFRAYVAQAVHGWRLYYATGKDDAQPVGQKQFKDRLMRFSAQPPAVVDVDHLWTPAEFPTYQIRKVEPTTGVTLGNIDLVECIQRVTDENDRPGEEENGT